MRGFLELSRVSNAPTVVSNALVGCALASVAGGAAAEAADVPYPWTTFLAVAAAMILLYVGGMALNDIADTAHDLRERPDRPIPSGRVSRSAALAWAAVALALGLGLLCVHGAAATQWGAILVCAIIAYDLLHKRFAWAAPLMGACRALVYVTAAAAVDPAFERSAAFTVAGASLAYVTLVTIAARREHTEGAARGIRWPVEVGLAAAAFAPVVVLHPRSWLAASAAAVLLVANLTWAWSCRRGATPRLPQAIMAWLAGISLADLFVVALLARFDLALVAFGCFAVTALGHRRIAGT